MCFCLLGTLSKAPFWEPLSRTLLRLISSLKALTRDLVKIVSRIFYKHSYLVSPYRAILRYYRCDTPCRAILFQAGLHSPKMVRYPPWHLVSHRHICAIPRFATYRAIVVRDPTKTSTKEFCDTIAASITRYEKYRYWASKHSYHSNHFLNRPTQKDWGLFCVYVLLPLPTSNCSDLDR